MRPRPLSKNQPARPGKIDKKQRLNKKSRVLKTDESILKQSVKTCVNGLDKVIKVLENGTEEVVDFLSNECSIIYECRVCSSLFRSLANFIAHKRVYCRKKVTDLETACDGQIEETMLSVTADFQKGILSTRSTSRRDIVNFLDTLQSKVTTKETAPDLFAVELEATKEALFHCFRHEGKHCSEERSATLGPDGKILGTTKRLANGANFDEEYVNNEERAPSPTANVNSEDSSCILPCPHCPKKFPSDRSLQSHTKSVHNVIYRTCYSCPCCKKYLANTWSVYRHLSKVHKKSNEQIRKLRSQIQKKQITDDDYNKSKAQVQNIVHPQEGIKSVEPETEKPTIGGSGELHRCYICGKWFERRVVMLSHAQICRDKNNGLPCVSTVPDPLKVSDSIEILSNKRPRTDSPSPPPIPKSGIEVRTYYEKNKPPSLNNTTTSTNIATPATPPDTMHLKPKALALLASLPRARVVLTKTPVPVAAASRVAMTTPSPPPSDPELTSSREFSPRAEDVISRYRARQNFTSQIFERRDSLSPSCKVAVESVDCSDTDDSNNSCEYVLGAREIANCIGTVDCMQFSNSSLRAELEEEGTESGDLMGAGSFAERECIRNIKEEPASDEEQFQLDCKSEELETIKQEMDSCVEEEEEEEVEDDEEIDEDNVEEEREEDDSRFENIQEQSSFTDLESTSDIDETIEGRSAINNHGQDDEDDDSDEYEDVDEDEEEETEDEDENSLENNKVVTREDSLIKEQVLNGLLKNGIHHPFRNGISSKYAVSWIYRKINSYIDGPKKKCLLCLKTFHRLNLVRRHVASHLNIFNFKCMIDKCDFKCFLRTDMVKHLLRIHKKREVRRNRFAYMKRITNDMIPIDDNGVPCVPFLPIFPSNKNSISSVNKLDIAFENVPKHEKLLPEQIQPHSVTRTSSVDDDSDTNKISNCIDLQVESGEGTLSNRMEDEDSTISSTGNLKEFHTTNMQMCECIY